MLNNNTISRIYILTNPFPVTFDSYIYIVKHKVVKWNETKNELIYNLMLFVDCVLFYLIQRLFRIISIPSKFCYFRPPDHVISMECSVLNIRCQCTQQKLQSIYAVLTFDHQLKNILTFSVKDRYQLNYFICIKDFNAETITSLKLNLFSFFICCCQHHERIRSDFIYFWY